MDGRPEEDFPTGMTATISTRGQVVIPRTIREELELRPGDDLEVVRRQNEVVLRRVGSRPRRKLSAHLKALGGVEIPRWDKPLFPGA
jgi:AbrB family looped-hinge helix DNA binding protein